MLSEAFLLLAGSALLMLRLGSNSGSFPRPLTPEEEQDCIARWLEGDLAARNILIEHNLRLVAHIIKKYYTQTAEQDDLISIGTIGLIKGISTYRPEKGVRLATYASRCIENEILMYFRGTKKTAGELSLSESLEQDREGDSLSLMDIVAQDDDMLERISGEETACALHRYVEICLSPREQEIIRMRYGLSGKERMTQREVAEVCGISRSYISRIEKKAIEKLRAAFESEACVL